MLRIRTADPRRFIASFSDVTHAGLASCCRVLICADEDLVMNARCSFERPLLAEGRPRPRADTSRSAVFSGSPEREEKMQTLLHAGFVSVDELQDALIVGFSDRQFDTSRYLMLQRSLNPDDDAGVYLEHNNQAFSTYGTVSRCLLCNGRIEMTVDDTTAKSLGTETTFAIEFPYDQASLRRLRISLERIFHGTPCRFKTSGDGV